jgi:hypothetical protein
MPTIPSQATEGWPGAAHEANDLGGKAELGVEGRCVHVVIMEPQMENRSRATHGEFTLETDELRDTVPRVCFTKLHMQETKHKQE